MSEDTLKCFKSQAIEFLDKEIDSHEEAKASLFGFQLSASSIASDAFGGLVNKGAKGATKSIEQHLGEFAKNTTNFFDKYQSTTTSNLKNAFTAFSKTVDKLNGGTDSSLIGIIASLASNESVVYAMAKNGSTKSSRLAGERVTVSSNLINTINEMATLRQDVGQDALSQTPETAAEAIRVSVNNAISLLSLISVSSSRLPVTYNRALSELNEALDLLKIGAGEFTLHEYMRLRLDYKLYVLQFSEIDLDLQTSIDTVMAAESDYEENKDNIIEAENKYIDEVIKLLKEFSRDVKAAIDKDTDNVVLEMFPEWSNELMAIYSMAYGAYDEGVESAVKDPANPDKKAYESLSTTYGTLKDDLDKQDLVRLMNVLAEDYFSFLNGDITEQAISAKESVILEELLEVAQNDQLLIDAGNAYNVTIMEILAVIATSTGRAGLDKISDAIGSGDVSGLFGALTENLGSTASGTAACLGASIGDLSDPQTRDLMLRVNTRVQAIQRKKQLVGALRDGNLDSAIRSVDSTISRTKRLREQLAATEV